MNCRFCSYYRPRHVEVGKPKDGECMFSPPEMFPSFHGEAHFIAVRPTVKPGEWCSEFRENPMASAGGEA